MLCYACYAILYYAMLCYAMLYYTMLYYTMLCYAIVITLAICTCELPLHNEQFELPVHVRLQYSLNCNGLHAIGDVSFTGNMRGETDHELLGKYRLLV